MKAGDLSGRGSLVEVQFTRAAKVKEGEDCGGQVRRRWGEEGWWESHGREQWRNLVRTHHDAQREDKENRKKLVRRL